MGIQWQHCTSYNYQKVMGTVGLQQSLQGSLLICSRAHLSLKGKQPCITVNTVSGSEESLTAPTLQLIPECSQCSPPTSKNKNLFRVYFNYFF